MAFRTFTRRLYSSSSVELNGMFIPLTTPFKADQSICYESLGSNLKKYEKIPFKGYLVSGTTGESPYLSYQERVDLVKFVRENTSKEKVIIGGVTTESTRMSCDLTQELKKAGADGVLIMLPFYFKRFMTEDAIMTHFTTLADEGGLPVVVYNNPWVTGMDIGTPILAKLARHPSIRGVKDSDVRKNTVTLMETKGCNFDVLTGSAGYLLASLMIGCSGGFNGLAGILGHELCRICQLVEEKKFEEAIQLQIKVSKPDVLLLAEMGVRGLKGAMDMKGYFGGVCRKPALPLNDEEKHLIRETLKSTGFL
ncbi:4-hydroxy-2-oxoglutarate aldolase, mitochondrial-like [Cimex lectularius]|uniref:4-hydroxy-2-oxoglutarate aldolase, mitochondrial n=1 Tax=Cimex lectularius TaxID=79782 RepID=A0A8I6SPW8_CIMLE|nr:4-hydroxy-2-oxoglutarate aldolase, mitochondrial-like [Cimex lectularius]